MLWLLWLLWLGRQFGQLAPEVFFLLEAGGRVAGNRHGAQRIECVPRAPVPVRREQDARRLADGIVGGDSLVLPGEETLSVAELKAAHEAWFPAYMASQPAGVAA